MSSTVRQIPEVNTAKQIKPEKIPGGGFIYAICFKLPKPAEADGYIVQHIVQEEEGTNKIAGTENKNFASRRIEYWEAWEVRKGETEPRQTQSVRDFMKEQSGDAPPHGYYDLQMNDIFYKMYKLGTKGKYTITGLAGFYHEPLPPDFIVNHPKTGAYGLRSTIHIPKFWSCCGLMRQIRFQYDCETESNRKDPSKHSLNWEYPRVYNMSYMDGWVHTGK
jgi:hypothetical protein